MRLLDGENLLQRDRTYPTCKRCPGYKRKIWATKDRVSTLQEPDASLVNTRPSIPSQSQIVPHLTAACHPYSTTRRHQDILPLDKVGIRTGHNFKVPSTNVCSPVIVRWKSRKPPFLTITLSFKPNPA